MLKIDDNFLTEYEAIDLLKQGYDLEYYREGYWMLLLEDQPIRILWEYKIRKKKSK